MAKGPVPKEEDSDEKIYGDSVLSRLQTSKSERAGCVPNTSSGCMLAVMLNKRNYLTTLALVLLSLSSYKPKMRVLDSQFVRRLPGRSSQRVSKLQWMVMLWTFNQDQQACNTNCYAGSLAHRASLTKSPVGPSMSAHCVEGMTPLQTALVRGQMGHKDHDIRKVGGPATPATKGT